MIPRVVHKIWFNFKNTPEGEHPPQNYIDSENRCKKINKDWNFIRWNEAMANHFIQKNYPFFYDRFMNYPKKIQKVDAVRYFILYHYGGVYMDMDIDCEKQIELNDDKVSLIEDVNSLYILNLVKFNNFFMASPPRHNFWKTVFQKLIQNYKRKWWQDDFWFVLSSTGPKMLSDAYNDYEQKSEIEILKREDYNPCDTCGVCSTSIPYIKHSGHALWTNDIYAMMRVVYCYKNAIFFTIALVIIFVAIILFIKFKK